MRGRATAIELMKQRRRPSKRQARGGLEEKRRIEFSPLFNRHGTLPGAME
jgi:hypothetical protein